MLQPRRNTALAFARREFLGISLVAFTGCTSPLIRGQSPAVEDLAAEDESQAMPLVGDYCGSWGTDFKKVEAIGLVTNLNNTGSDPPPSQARESLLGEMRSRNVKDPQKLLTSPKVSMVQVTGLLPPAVQKGDPIDVFIGVPKKSTTTSLRGGWLMKTYLQQLGFLGGRVRRGRELGIAEGNVIIDSIFSGDGDATNEVRGRILGGGIAKETRTLGLVIRRDDVSIETTSVIAGAVNGRFHTFDRGSKKGVAEPKNATFVKLLVPPSYKYNLGRYTAVVRSIPLREAPVQRAQRLEVLEQKLFEPTTCAKASLQLEAIGKEAIPVLKKGLVSRDAETRFHSAEALAYLDEPQSAKVLGETARNEAAFRWSSLTALQSMDHVHAYEALNELLHVPSAETRYGAFRALRVRNPSDPLVRGESLSGQLSLHMIPTTGEPMIHISKSVRAEIVLFGQSIRMGSPKGLFAGKHIMLTATDAEQIKLSRFAPGEADRVVFAPPVLDQVIRAIVSIGGTYGDVIQMIHQAKQQNLIAVRVDVDALPDAGRSYYRDAPESGGDDSSEDLDALVDGASEPKTDSRPVGSDSLEGIDDGELSETYVDPKFTPATDKGVWSKVTDWFSWSK